MIELGRINPQDVHDALKAICKRFGVSTELSAEDAAKKVLEALERDYMALPKDADGVRIEIGDRLHEHDYGQEFTVEGLKIYGSDREWWAYRVNGTQAPVSRCTHVKPRTLESVLSDLADEVWEASCTCQTTWSDSGLDGIEERYAAEIRAMFGEVDDD